jgi:hypothetical protein
MRSVHALLRKRLKTGSQWPKTCLSSLVGGESLNSDRNAPLFELDKAFAIHPQVRKSTRR